MMPKITYCIPQIASFGYTEKQAEEKGFRFHVLRADFSGQTKAHCNDEIQGWIKVLVEKGTDKILGSHMIGNQVEDIIAQLTLCQASGIPFSDLGSAIHGHPTLSEIIGDLARNHQFSN